MIGHHIVSLNEKVYYRLESYEKYTKILKSKFQGYPRLQTMRFSRPRIDK